jgi:hypothetical protein
MITFPFPPCSRPLRLPVFLTLVTVIASTLPTVAAPTNLVAHSDLPRGPGLAAALASAQSIHSHPDVLFSDDFEHGSIGKGWDEVGNRNGKVLSLANPGLPALGKHSLRVESHLGQDTGGGLTRWFEPTPRLFIRFYTRFDAQCDYIHHFVTLRANRGLSGGNRWSGFGGAGIKPAGDDRFSTAIEPWGNWGKNPPPGQWNFYSYWHEMTPSPDGKYWGNSFIIPDAPPIPRERWICVEFMLQENSPGQPDGQQAFWIDGVLLGHWKNINWRKSATLHANALTLETCVTDRWTKNPVNVVFFDDIVIARQYIGPVPGTLPPER